MIVIDDDEMFDEVSAPVSAKRRRSVRLQSKDYVDYGNDELHSTVVKLNKKSNIPLVRIVISFCLC